MKNRDQAPIKHPSQRGEPVQFIKWNDRKTFVWNECYEVKNKHHQLQSRVINETDQMSTASIREPRRSYNRNDENLKLQRIDEAKKIEIWFSTKIKKRI
jgi:hypothetical protein